MSEYIVDYCNVNIVTDKPANPYKIKRFEITLEERGEIVRCRDCKHYREVRMADGTTSHRCSGVMAFVDNPTDGFCAWGERADRETVEVWKPASPEDVTNHFLTCKCGEELETEGKCPSCGRWVHD